MATKKKKIEIAIVAALITGACAIGAAFINRASKSSAQNQQTVTVGSNNTDTSIAVVNGSNSQATINRSVNIAQTNSGQIQGQIFAPSQPITLTQIFNNTYGGSNPPVPDTGLREWVSNLDVRTITNTSDIHVTREELINLTKLLARIDERTAVLERLPDGTVRLGRIIAGAPTVVLNYITNARDSFTKGDFAGALISAQHGLDAMETSKRPNIISREVDVNEHGIGALYYLASGSAQRMSNDTLANDYAQKALQQEPTPLTKELVTSTLANLAQGEFSKGNFAEGLLLYSRAITNHESIDLKDVVLDKGTIEQIYARAAYTALKAGNTNLLVEYATKLSTLTANAPTNANSAESKVSAHK